MMSCLLHSIATILEGLKGCLFTNCKIYIISHSGLRKIIINLDNSSIFIKCQGEKLFSKIILKNYPFNLTNTHFSLIYFFTHFTHGTLNQHSSFHLNQHSSFDFGAMNQLWYTNGMAL